MDNQRLVIWAIFGLLAWMTYQAWQRDYAPPAPQVVSNPAPANDSAAATGMTDTTGLPTLPDEAVTADAEPGDALPTLDPALPEQAPRNDIARIEVLTDVLDIVISTQGGTLESAAILHYPVAKDRPEEVVNLLSTDPMRLALLQTGLISSNGAAANHLATFASSRSRYELGDADELLVPLTWSDENGVTVTKTFRFRRGSYIIGLQQTLSNNSDAAWRGAEYAQLQRYLIEQKRSMFDVDTYSFNGPIVYDGDKAEKLKRDELEDDGPREFKSEQGWFGAIQHHFVTAVVPEAGGAQTYTVALSGQNEISRAIGNAQTVAPGATLNFSSTLFVGPKLQEQLEQVNDKLHLTVDYGWLTPISRPLFLLLSFVFGIVSNWGVAIILVTILIKLVFYKLTEASGRSMAKMRNLQPRIKALQERYKDDRQAQSQAMMELYKTEKVNPAAGCLPILIQMPFFLAFYWVLLESVEMRQAPFALWIGDLSSRDPYFILPLIMGAAMFFQQKLNPQVGDPVQVKVMQIMPIIFTGFFAFFPAGLVLYWVTNTLLSIAQQWKINKVVEAEGKQHRGGKRASKS